MMVFIRISILSFICDLTLFGICFMFGSLFIRLVMSFIFFIWRSCLRKSLRSKSLFFFSLLVNFFVCARLILFSIFSISDSTSFMSRIRDAMRFGWNGFSVLVFSLISRNLIGLLVMWRIESVVSSRVSSFILVNITSVSGNVLLNVFVVLVVFWSVMALIINRVLIGLIDVWICLISFIIVSLTCRRLAVFISSTS